MIAESTAAVVSQLGEYQVGAISYCFLSWSAWCITAPRTNMRWLLYISFAREKRVCCQLFLLSAHFILRLFTEQWRQTWYSTSFPPLRWQSCGGWTILSSEALLLILFRDCVMLNCRQIVTGAGAGLGREHALELARRGCKVGNPRITEQRNFDVLVVLEQRERERARERGKRARKKRARERRCRVMNTRRQ